MSPPPPLASSVIVGAAAHMLKALTIGGPGTLSLTGASTFTGTTTSAAAPSCWSACSAVRRGHECLDADGRNDPGRNSAMTFAEPIRPGSRRALLGNSARPIVFTCGVTVNGASNVLNINDSGGALSRASSAPPPAPAPRHSSETAPVALTLTGANAYTGVTLINAGIVNVQNATGLGAVAPAAVVESGATLQLQGGITIGANRCAVRQRHQGVDGALKT